MSSSREKERNARKKKQKIRRRRQVMIIAVELVLLIILGGCCYVISSINAMQGETLDHNKIYRPDFAQKDNDNESNQQEGDQTAPENGDDGKEENHNQPVFNYNDVMDQYWNILLVGVDARDNESLTSKVRSDVMMVCSINKKTNEIKLASVYRDTYMKMADGRGYQKANSALFYGDIYDTINTLNMNLDLYLTDYVVVNWSAVAKCINLLGGIEADITEDFITTGFYNSLVTETVQSTGIPSTQIWEPGHYTLDGVQAVAYCRLRHSDSDYQRTARQREVMSQLLNKAQNEVKQGNVGLLISMMNEVIENVRMSISDGDLLNMIINARSFKLADQTGYPFEKSGSQWVGNISFQYPVVPINVEKNVRELHQFLYGDNGYEPSSKLKEISDYVKEISGLG